MTEIHPDLDWYLNESKDESSSPRCPYANVHRCHRYYSSLYLMGEVKITTKITPEKVKKLDEMWEASDLLPVVEEHEAGIGSYDKKAKDFTNFCPEISYDVFGLFSSVLYKYADEIDRDLVHQQLSRKNSSNSWRWEWSHIQPMHYLRCPVYSQILSNDSGKVDEVKEPEDIITLKPTLFGFSLDIKALIRKVRSKNASNKRI